MSSTLDTFITSSKPAPAALATSQEIRDRGSSFVASIYRASSSTSAKDAVRHHKNVVHGSRKATHEISAWRVMTLKFGRDGLGGPEDFELSSGCDDDGENYAGKKVLKVLESEGILDAVVIVSRWYGGILLGPVRFTHIETCAREVCGTFKAIEEVEEHIATLKDLDAQLQATRDELALLNPPKDATDEDTVDVPAHTGAVGVLTNRAKTHDYSMLLSPPDPARARRLVGARTNALSSVQTLLACRGVDA